MRKLASIWPIFGGFCLCHSIFRASCDLFLGRDQSKKPHCPKLNHSIPQVGTKHIDRGTNNGSKISHTLANLGNMMLFPKLAKPERA
jgi:hypothetical protein